jgi:zinc/manganese transport system permease protein
MDAFVRSMTYPFLACLVLTGIHVYLGIHVISRKVIFVDLALATIAALGAVWGALLGWDIHEDVWAVKGFSLCFTFVGAAVFSLTRMRHERVPQEAIIGITYAVALAAIILGSAKLPHGAEEVRDLQAGSILWVSGQTILTTAILYAVIGGFHYVFRRRFFAISLDPEGAQAQGIPVRWWDFLFYVSFGFVVTSSVAIAGVLLVFSYLVIPSVVAVLFADGIGKRLAIGWTVGTLISALGVSISYFEDLPSGPVIVVCFGAFLGCAGVAHYLLHSPQRKLALARVVGGALLASLLLGGSQLLRKREDVDLVHWLESGAKSEKIFALLRVEAQPELWPKVRPLVPALLAMADIEVRLKLLELIAERKDGDFLANLHELLLAPDDVVREQTLKVLRVLGRRESIPHILRAAAQEEDDDLKVELAEAALEFGDAGGVELLLDVLDRGRAQQARRDAYEHLNAHLHTGLTYHAEAEPSARAVEVEAIRQWWREHASGVHLEDTASVTNSSH